MQLAPGQSSITDRDDWRDFCRRAADDLSLIRDGEPVLDDVIGGVSFAEARYEAIADRFEVLFGPMDGWTVLEVGGGYGGQARVLFERWAIYQYVIADLVVAQQLQSVYLAERGRRLGALMVGSPDFAFSNYALSEIEAKQQTRLARIMATAPRGYITWNGWTVDDGLQKDELQALIPGSVWIPEEPASRPENACLVWGSK